MPTKITKRPSSTRSTPRRTSKKPVKRSLFAKLFLAKSGKPNFILGLIIVLAVSGLGYFGYVKSSANTTPYVVGVNQAGGEGCKLAGRVWDEKANNGKGDCLNECRHKSVAGNEFKRTTTEPVRGYCSAAINVNMDISRCNNDLHRKYVKDIGCARRPAQLNTNDANQCIPPFDNYVAEARTDRCIKADLGQTGKNTPGAPTPANNNSGSNDNLSNGGKTPVANTEGRPILFNKEQCALLGRVWKNNSCSETCPANRGPLLVGERAGNKYCAPSLATNMTEDNCVTKYHRVWFMEGCARRPDQKDANKAPQCQKDYPYYNANFTSAAGKTGLDVCEKDKATAVSNESNGILGGEVVANFPAGGSSAPADPNSSRDDAIAGNYKITVYADVNFKGKEKTFTNDTPEMPKGWNDRVSSFKIHKGQWLICTDIDYKASCVKRFAGDADLTQGNKEIKNDTISSLRPHVPTVYDEAPAQCLNADGVVVTATPEGCPENTALSCVTGQIYKDGVCKERTYPEAAYAPVDKAFKGKEGKAKCALLGREWISAGNGGQHGCSIVTCAKQADGAPRANDGKSYCVSSKFDAPYAIKLGEKECKNLHRVWINQVGLCAQVPNRKDKDQTINPADACVKGYQAYYIYKAKERQDECFKPKFFQRVQGVVGTTGGLLGNALQLGPKAYCNTKSGYHWSESRNKCVKDRPKPTANPSGTTTGPADSQNAGTPAGGGKINCGVMGTVSGSVCPYANQSACAALHREWSGGECQSRCADGWTGYTVTSPYNKCLSKDDKQGTPGGNGGSPSPSVPKDWITIYGLDNAGASTRTLYSSAGGLGDNPNTASVTGGRSWAVCGTPNETYPRSGGTFYADQHVVCTGHMRAGSYNLSAMSVYVAGKTSSTCQVSSCKVSQMIPAWTLNNVSVQ